MSDQPKVILDLCGGTGAWSKPYRDAGYTVNLITLPLYDVTRVRFEKYAMHFERMDKHYEDWDCVLFEDVYGILAAPPCTEFSVAKGSQPRDFAGAMKIVEACLRIIWHCRIHGKLKFWAMENPVGLLRQLLGKPLFTFQQWQFGDAGVKPTDLWGYFNNPKPTNAERPDSPALIKRYKTGKSPGKINTLACTVPYCPPEYAHLNLDRAALRAITPPGFAQAFFKANR